MTDYLTHDHLRALLAEERTKRAEIAFHAAIARAEKAEAACAEMRAALEGIARADESVGGCAFCLYEENGHKHTERCAVRAVDRALLARPDLGAGKVLVEREVLERCRKILWANRRVLDNVLLADLDALLKKGGG